MEWNPDGSVTSPSGFEVGTHASRIKYDSRTDLALLHSTPPSACAAVFTRNQVVAAPVTLDRATLLANNSAIQAVVVNSGNANACTGATGLANAQQMQILTAQALDCPPDAVLVLSTEGATDPEAYAEIVAPRP